MAAKGATMPLRDMAWPAAWFTVLASLAFAATGGWCHTGLALDEAVWLCVAHFVLSGAGIVVCVFERPRQARS